MLSYFFKELNSKKQYHQVEFNDFDVADNIGPFTKAIQGLNDDNNKCFKHYKLKTQIIF